MHAIQTNIMGSYLIDLDLFEDSRGSFAESYCQKKYQQMGINENFVQDNRSRSKKNVLRGLHYQVQHPIGHLIYVLHGSVFDVGLDLRVKSPTFGHVYCHTLSAQQNQQLYLPPGVAHGFLALEQYNEILYKCTDYYYPEDEAGVVWNDPDLAIPWPTLHPEIKGRDANFPRLKELLPTQLPVVTEPFLSST